MYELDAEFGETYALCTRKVNFGAFYIKMGGLAYAVKITSPSF